MNHPTILAGLHQAVVFRSRSQGCPGSVGSGSVMIPVGFTSPMPGLQGTALDRKGPSSCSRLLFFVEDPIAQLLFGLGK